ncbi:hypothetical protein WKI71_32320 [Streptomyces sp. MS1.AVA.1]|uniref:Uncharacterized protein n=1 Tax=Streptomyces machairae TaxID=3134109 RepID=A0ABU8UR42_9ACTN
MGGPALVALVARLAVGGGVLLRLRLRLLRGLLLRLGRGLLLRRGLLRRGLLGLGRLRVAVAALLGG